MGLCQSLGAGRDGAGRLESLGLDIGSPVILLGLEDAGEATADAVRAAHARAVSAVGPALLPVRPARRPVAESPPKPTKPQEGVAELSGEQRAACAAVLCRHIDLARGTAAREPAGGGLAALALAVPGAPCPACGGDGGDGAPAHVFDEAAPPSGAPTGRLVRTAEPIEPAAVRRLFGPPTPRPRRRRAPQTGPRPGRRPAARPAGRLSGPGRLLKLLASLGAGEQAAELRDLLPSAPSPRASAPSAASTSPTAILCRSDSLRLPRPRGGSRRAASSIPARVRSGGPGGAPPTTAAAGRRRPTDPAGARRAQTYASRSFFRRGTEDIRQFALRHLPAEAPADEVLEMDRDAVVALVVLAARRLGWPAPDPGRQPGAQRWLEMSDAHLVALRSGDELAAARAPRDATCAPSFPVSLATGGGGGNDGGAGRSKRRRRGEPGVSHASAIEDEEAD
eukprot:tig00000923_g5478.t1